MNSPVVCSNFQSTCSVCLSLSSISTSSGTEVWSCPRQGAASPRREEVVGATQAFSPSWKHKITDHYSHLYFHTIKKQGTIFCTFIKTAPAFIPAWAPVCVPVPGPAAALLVVATHCHSVHSLGPEPTEPDWGHTHTPEAEGGPTRPEWTLKHHCSPVGGQTNARGMCSHLSF